MDTNEKTQENSMSRSVVVDVDLTVVDTLTPWVTWWEKRVDTKFDWSAVNKDLSINKQLHQLMSCEEALTFWRNPELYDNLTPLTGSRNALRLLKSMGYDLFFVSNCEDDHVESKRRFLDKYFPFHDGLIDTCQKHSIEADIYFDDHVEYVDKILKNRPYAKVYQFVTPDNEYQLNTKATPLHNWRDFAKLQFGE
mgnify:CR=1 FL=1